MPYVNTTVKSDEEDQGLPESPIYSNYSNRLWAMHIRQGSMPSPNRSHENTNGPRLSPDGPTPAQEALRREAQAPGPVNPDRKAEEAAL
jgi:hypothetical protein